MDSTARIMFEFPGERECTNCSLHEHRNLVVLTEGSPSARIMFIGEAPGFNEDKTGLPFHGAAGKNLNTLLGLANINREDVIIANMIACAPWRYAVQTDQWQIGKPKKSEIDQCAVWLDKKILESNVEIVIPLGNYSLSKFLPKTTIGKVHGKVFEVEFTSPYYPGKSKMLHVMPMYHPAAPLHKPELRQILVDDYRLLPNAIHLVPSEPPFDKYRIATTAADLKEIGKEIRKHKLITLDYEATGLNPEIDEVVGVVISTHENSAWYIPTFDDWWKPERIINGLSEFIYDPAYTLIIFNKDYEGRMTYKYTKRWISRPNVYDVMLEWYLLSAEVKDLKGLELRVLNVKAIEIEELNRQITDDYNAKVRMEALEEWCRMYDNVPPTFDNILKNGKLKQKKFKVPKFKAPKKVSNHIDMLEASRRDLHAVVRYACPDGDLCLQLHNIAIPQLRERGLLESIKYKEMETIYKC